MHNNLQARIIDQDFSDLPVTPCQGEQANVSANIRLMKLVRDLPCSRAEMILFYQSGNSLDFRMWHGDWFFRDPLPHE
ncbi:hypothetical protein [Desulfonatronovibrio magnus]|uniref:hypothetical protein n=1 Tax=Desulfonatronovibrio magnus TaxID=698827 RepID=UPI0005EBACE0|nr:hypothetical protein [Desulfonatronovibrio magnus]